VPENRDDAGRFPQGVSGNPGGRPKKLEALAASIREFDDELRDKLLAIVRTGSDKDAREAIKLLWSYAHGLPRQVVTDADGNAVHLGLVILPNESK
jgi:hypothetical protein